MAEVTSTELAAKIEAFVATVADRDALIYAWLTGTATGGPSLDGYYPVKDYSGAIRLLPSLEKIETELAADKITGVIYTATWAELAAISTTGLTANMGAMVLADAGTHTDPITSATVANEGVYKYVTGTPNGWQRIANLDAMDAESAATAAAASAASTSRVIGVHYTSDTPKDGLHIAMVDTPSINVTRIYTQVVQGAGNANITILSNGVSVWTGTATPMGAAATVSFTTPVNALIEVVITGTNTTQKEIIVQLRGTGV